MTEPTLYWVSPQMDTNLVRELVETGDLVPVGRCEPTLYRYEAHPECPVYGERHREEQGSYVCKCGARDMWHRAVPVERCEHGMIDGHAYRTDHRDPTHTAWCPGSPTLHEPDEPSFHGGVG